MPNTDTMVVSVRIQTSDLETLQALALMYEKPVGELIREAVGKYVQAIADSKEFKNLKSQIPPGRALDRVNELMGKKSKPIRKTRAVRTHKL